MRLKELDDYYFQKNEPVRSCLLALRKIIIEHDKNLNETWKYKTPCFDYKNKLCCYLWIDKKTNWPYIGIVKGCEIKHPQLTSGGRKQIKTYLVNPEEDIPIEIICSILNLMVDYYEKRI